jgi:hypothetical protein
MVMVNTVVAVRSVLSSTDETLQCAGRDDSDDPSAPALDRMADRPIMLMSAGVLGGALLAAIVSVLETVKWLWQPLLATWTIFGVA